MTGFMICLGICITLINSLLRGFEVVTWFFWGAFVLVFLLKQGREYAFVSERIKAYLETEDFGEIVMLDAAGCYDAYLQPAREHIKNRDKLIEPVVMEKMMERKRQIDQDWHDIWYNPWLTDWQAERILFERRAYAEFDKLKWCQQAIREEFLRREKEYWGDFDKGPVPTSVGFKTKEAFLEFHPELNRHNFMVVEVREKNALAQEMLEKWNREHQERVKQESV